MRSRPALVEAALALARHLEFERSCEDDVGRLLRVLAAAVRPGGLAGEIGTGCGVGTAWIASGLSHGSRVISVESDAERASRARELLAGEVAATVIHGDWTSLLPHGPFDLLFVDARPAKDDPLSVLSAVGVGGFIVLDDIHGHWPRDRGAPDPVRERWLGHSGLLAAEVGIDYGADGFPGSAIVAVKKGS